MSRAGGVPGGVPAAPVSYGPRIAAAGVYLLHGQFLSTSRTAQALGELFGAPVAAGTVASWTRRIASTVTATVIPAIRDRVAAAPVAHFDETGMRVAGRLAWMHSASTATDVLLSVHPRRGVAGMENAGVLPAFTGVAVHDAWAPYDTYTAASHALCNAHLLRELVYVVDTGTTRAAAMANQALDALRCLKKLTDGGGDHGPDTTVLAAHRHALRSAAVLGATATAGRSTSLERKHHNLFRRITGRFNDYLRFTHDPRVPFDNNPAERTIRMPKLRIKVSGCLRTPSGAQHFAAIRSYTATAARHGLGTLDVLIRAATGRPWTPTPA